MDVVFEDVSDIVEVVVEVEVVCEVEIVVVGGVYVDVVVGSTPVVVVTPSTVVEVVEVSEVKISAPCRLGPLEINIKPIIKQSSTSISSRFFIIFIHISK